MVSGADESKDLNQSNISDTSSPKSDISDYCTEDYDKTISFRNEHPLPHGNYTMIGIDIDTTGRRLIDEIVQISAYTPKTSYSQYIMPLMNLNPAARQRHQVRVITVGFFRMLKSMHTYKVVKTKTEVAVLNEFIEWLEQRDQENPDSDGVVLIYHEQRKFVPYMMIEALKKYNLLDRFTQTVKSFANGYKLAEEKCSKEVTIKYFTIRQLAKLIMNENDKDDTFEGHAYVRARLAYEIFKNLATADDDDVKKTTNGDDDADQTITSDITATTSQVAATNDTTTTTVTKTTITLTDEEINERMLTALCELASPITKEISELSEQEKILMRQNSLRSVFLQYFKTTLYHRVKAVTYRRVLAECGYDYDSLNELWTTNKDDLNEALTKLHDLKEEERKELYEILDCHFDPDKQSLKPVVKRTKRRSSRGRPFFANNRNNVGQMNQNQNNNLKDNNNNNNNNGGGKGRRNSRNFTPKSNNNNNNNNNMAMATNRSPNNNNKGFGGGRRQTYSNNNRRRYTPRRQNYYNNNNRNNNMVAINA